MSRLEKEYKINDKAEARRITLAIITAGAIIGLILSVIANIALLKELAERIGMGMMPVPELWGVTSKNKT